MIKPTNFSKIIYANATNAYQLLNENDSISYLPLL